MGINQPVSIFLSLSSGSSPFSVPSSSPNLLWLSFFTSSPFALFILSLPSFISHFCPSPVIYININCITSLPSASPCPLLFFAFSLFYWTQRWRQLIFFCWHSYQNSFRLVVICQGSFSYMSCPMKPVYVVSCVQKHMVLKLIFYCCNCGSECWLQFLYHMFH